MAKELVYYTPSVEAISKRKHVLFLEKSGYLIHKCYAEEDLRGYLESSSPAGMILTEEETLDKVENIQNIPVLLILKQEKNVSELIDKFAAVRYPIFFRYENDPINTILETVKLIYRWNNTK